ncbi:dihydroneopterin aldolase [Actinocrinis puniceicyclus]|uniref:7,8-dihydroneopterin aldolase n=1 Tax=Actinocrinis puniceicyclus TaxID=977794 RepID=A0A8J8BGT9_9ACTN|nr:dihydroneopterin aldolase [Actinocrinis puniceicyclus]
MDRIELLGLRGRGRHGVFPRERAEGQTFIVDAALGVDVRAAAVSDDLAATADYGAIAEKIVALVEGEPVNLIETLAERIAAACLADPAVREVQITVHKPDAPISVPFDDVTVTVRRRTEARQEAR